MQWPGLPSILAEQESWGRILRMGLSFFFLEEGGGTWEQALWKRTKAKSWAQRQREHRRRGAAASFFHRTRQATLPRNCSLLWSLWVIGGVFGGFRLFPSTPVFKGETRQVAKCKHPTRVELTGFIYFSRGHGGGGWGVGGENSSLSV